MVEATIDVVGAFVCVELAGLQGLFAMRPADEVVYLWGFEFGWALGQSVMGLRCSAIGEMYRGHSGGDWRDRKSRKAGYVSVHGSDREGL